MLLSQQIQQLLRDEAAETAEWRKLDINGNGNVRSLLSLL
jgi:hypothetical protein